MKSEMDLALEYMPPEAEEPEHVIYCAELDLLAVMGSTEFGAEVVDTEVLTLFNTYGLIGKYDWTVVGIV